MVYYQKLTHSYSYDKKNCFETTHTYSINIVCRWGEKNDSVNVFAV